MSVIDATWNNGISYIAYFSACFLRNVLNRSRVVAQSVSLYSDMHVWCLCDEFMYTIFFSYAKISPPRALRNSLAIYNGNNDLKKVKRCLNDCNIFGQDY